MTTATQSDRLIASLRQRIIAGEFAPGQRLPTFQELESRFRVSRSVAQLAVTRLKEDGFLRARTSRGLYVADRPPHLRRYGVVFAVPHGTPDWSQFDEVLVREARQLETRPADREFDFFAGTEDHRDGPGVLERLRREVRRDRLAGVIFTPGTHGLSLQEPFTDPTLPKVFIFAPPSDPWRPIVSADSPAMIRRGLGWLAQRGRRRVAMVRVSDYGAAWDWRSFYEEAGLDYRPQWVQAVGRCDPSVLQTLIPLLMDYPAEQRPDGLFIVDDNLVAHAAAAVTQMHLRIGLDLDLVAHCNWPCPTPSPLPIRRIGFHTGHLLARCLEAIDAQRRGEPPPPVQLVPALFEDEAEAT